MKIERGRGAGFTLVELVLAIAIIGLLVSVALPKFKSADVAGKAAQAKAALQAIEVAAESYSMDTGGYPGTTDLLVSSGYLKQNPTCEWQGSLYSYQISTSAGATFTFADGTTTTLPDYPPGTAFSPIFGTLREFRDAGTTPTSPEPPPSDEDPPGEL